MSSRTRKLAVIVHLNALVRVTPLVGGYLKAFAQADPNVRSDWDIELLSFYIRTPASTIVKEIYARRPDIVAFSVYTWNNRLVARLLTPLLGLLPSSRFLLGGVDVMNRGAEVLQPRWTNVAVCDGEGEKTFREFLLQAASTVPDFSHVGGLSYHEDGDLRTTTPHERIRDLMEIPSPWLNDVFQPADLAEIVLFETNRGCPFACEYCYWGGAIGQKVTKLELDRVKEEITYIARSKGKTLTLCDANFGLTKNDIIIAEHIAATKERFGHPSRVTFSTAKNNKNSITEISKILHRSGLINEQAVSLQSMNPKALAAAKRSNIKLEVYTDLQRELNRLQVASYIELIWPLPGETIETFKDGVQRLCEMGAHGFWIYPLLLLHNVGFAERTEELGLLTLEEPDPDGASPMVISTTEVSYEEFTHGLQFASAVFVLFTCRSLYTTLNLLNHLGVARFRDVFDAFVAWMATERDGAVSEIWREGVSHFEEMNKWTWQGALVHALFHEHRESFDKLLFAFYDECLRPLAKAAGHEEVLDSAFEFDVLNRPYLFLQTPLRADVPMVQTKVAERRRGRWIVETQYDWPAFISSVRTGETDMEEGLRRWPRRITIDHSSGLVFRLASKVDLEHYWHCIQSVRGMGNFEARYTVVTAEASDLALV